jgi:flavin reductase (DIM6/NTAB) family NADH-FMN oxidoreductase RutF
MDPGGDAPPQEFDFRFGGFVGGAPEGLGQWLFEEVPEPELIELGAGADADPRVEFRRTLGMFATGVTIITTQIGDSVHGMTANAFMSVSLEPPLVLISVDQRARLHGLLHEGKRYGISVLGAQQEVLSEHFAGRPHEGTEPRFAVVHETPLVDGAVAHLVAKVVRSYWGGDHSLFLGQVEYARYHQGTPLLFHGGRYEQLLGESSVFGALAPEQLERLLAAGSERSYEDGETIVRMGDPGHELFVILEGSVCIKRAGRELGSLSAGELFGEMAVFDGRARSADVVADGPVRCLAVPREALREAIEAEPQVAWELLSLLASRLRDQ